MTRKSIASTASENRDRLAAMGAVASELTSWRPQVEVLREVRSVPTIWPAYDRELAVGGHPTNRLVVVHGPSNEGKAHRNGTLVLTPSGWVSVEQIRVGQQVIGSDGGPCKVTGVYPRGVLEMYEVEFSDGFKTVCCGEHLWHTTTFNERVQGTFARGPRPERKRIPTGLFGCGSVKSIAEIAESLDEAHSVPTVGAVQFERLGDLPLDPYLLGLLLGDGGFTGSSVMFHKPEKDLWQGLASRLPKGDFIVPTDDTGVRINGGETKRRLAKLDLVGCRSWEKFVPAVYMRATVEDRLELLRGLLDTDGSVDKDGTGFEFSSTSDALADAVVDLARSLGAIVRDDDPRVPGYTYLGEKREGRPSRRVKIVFVHEGVIPVSSVKHLAKLNLRRRKQYRRIIAVRPVPAAEATCISVDSADRLYVVEGYLVTHNTSYALGLIRSFLARGHFAGFADAERSTPQAYVRTMVGELSTHPAFSALPVGTYEQVRASVREYCEAIATARKKGRIPADTTGLIVVDSIRKLVPKALWDKLSKELAQVNKEEPEAKPARQSKFQKPKNVGVDGAGGRAGQIKAALNAAWVDEIIPLLADCEMAMLLIARETTEEGEGFMAQEIVTVGGGAAINYDASLRLRVQRDYVKEQLGGKYPEMVGERIEVSVMKTKIHRKDEAVPRTYFHTSNGKLCPEGFDLARDCLELGLALGCVNVSGSYYAFGDDQLGNGKLNALRRLYAEPAMLLALERAVRTAP